MIAATIDNTIGAAFLGSIAASILFGVTMLQVFIYYQNYPSDWRYQKFSVAILMTLDCFHLMLTVHAVYHYAISSFGNLLAQLIVVWSFKLQIAVNIVIVLFVQTLYAIRVWKLGHHFSRVWPAVVIAFVAGGYAIGILLAVRCYQIETFAQLEKIAWVIEASFATSTVIDIIIATVLCIYLQRSRSSFIDSNYRILTIIKYVLVSGFFTSACSTAALVAFIAMPNNLVFLGIEFLLTKLYINSFIAMLNARKSVREKETSSSSKMSHIMQLRSGQSEASAIPLSPLSPVEKNALGLPTVDYRNRHQEYKIGGAKAEPELEISIHKSVETRSDGRIDFTHAV